MFPLALFPWSNLDGPERGRGPFRRSRSDLPEEGLPFAQEVAAGLTHPG